MKFAEENLSPCVVKKMALDRLKKGWPQLTVYSFEELAHKVATPRFEREVPPQQRPLVLVMCFAHQLIAMYAWLKRLSVMHGIKELDPNNGVLAALNHANALYAEAGYKVHFIPVPNFWAMQVALDEFAWNGRLVGVAGDVFEGEPNV